MDWVGIRNHPMQKNKVTPHQVRKHCLKIHIPFLFIIFVFVACKKELIKLYNNGLAVPKGISGAPFRLSPSKKTSFFNVKAIQSFKDNHDDLSGLGEDNASISEILEEIDDATPVHDDQHQAHFHDFHIVYSTSYKVPVLYFRGYCSDGCPLQLNEIETDLPSCSSKVLLQSKWTFITQEEHPWLNRPWYKLHPCGTSEWKKLLFVGDAAMAEKRIQLYLISWFSVVGQVVGLRIPIELVNGHSDLCGLDCNTMRT